MEEVHERLDNLNHIVSELYTRTRFDSINEDFRKFSWEQLCQEAKDILQWLKVYGNMTL